MARVIFLLLILNLSFGCAASDKVADKYIGSVPKEIYRLMKEKECSPVRGFYDRVIRSPPFVYVSNLFDDGTEMLFFVCEMDNQVADDKYKIVLMKEVFAKDSVHYVDFKDCPSEIYYRSMPGGLSVRSVSESESLDYNLWADTKNYKWSGRELPNRIDENPAWILDERHEGVGYGLFCAKGSWYNISYD